MNYKPFLSNSLLGLDVQPQGICLVQLARRGQHFVIKQLVMKPFLASVFIEDRIASWDKLQANLAEVVAELRLSGQSVAIAVPEALARMQTIVLSGDLIEAEIEAEIYQQLRRDLPGMSEALRIDFSVTSRCKDKLEVFFVAVRDEYLTQLTDCIESAGLKVKLIDIDVFSIARAVQVALPLSPVYLIAYGLAMRECPPW